MNYETEARENAIKEFERMKDMAELRALSKISLERQLSEREFQRMCELSEKVRGE
jgi:hypothetical protein